jgi:hypothetical protein
MLVPVCSLLVQRISRAVLDTVANYSCRYRSWVPEAGHGERQTVFVPALWYEIEVILDADQEFPAAGVSVENIAYGILAENAECKKAVRGKVEREP